jgi:hypothetical protein
MRFHARATTTGTHLLVGYLTAPADPTSFVSLHDIPLTNTEAEYVVTLNNALNGFIALKHGNQLVATNVSIFIDQLKIETIPNWPEFMCATDSLDFGTITIGDIVESEPIMIENIGMQPMHIWFTLPAGITAQWQSGTIAATDTLEIDEGEDIDVVFTYTASAVGTITGAIVIHHDAPGTTFLYTHTITISGEVEEEVDEIDEAVVPLVTALQGNYPNPFNPETTIVFSVGNAFMRSEKNVGGTDKSVGGTDKSVPYSRVSIDIYNIKGQKVRKLVDDIYPAGTHKVTWNGTDNNGKAVSSGIYFYRMAMDNYTSVKRMVLLK